MEGFARVRTGFSLVKMWVVLDGQDLMYYESLDLTEQRPKKLRGAMNVRDATVKKFQDKTYPQGIKVKNKATNQKIVFDCYEVAHWNSWFNALTRAVREHIEFEKRRKLPLQYREVLEIDPAAPKLSRGLITRAYKKISLREHPDKGGNADNFAKITEAYNYLLLYQNEMDERANCAVVQYEAIVEKANGIGMGFEVTEDKLREAFVVTNVSENMILHGLSAEAEGEIRNGDALVAIDHDEISGWYFARLKARLDTFRVPFGSKVVLVFERRVAKPDGGDVSPVSPLTSPAVTPVRGSAQSAQNFAQSGTQSAAQSTHASDSTATAIPMSAPIIIAAPPEPAAEAEEREEKGEEDTAAPPIVILTPPPPPPLEEEKEEQSYERDRVAERRAERRLSAKRGLELPDLDTDPAEQEERGEEREDNDDYSDYDEDDEDDDEEEDSQEDEEEGTREREKEERQREVERDVLVVSSGRENTEITTIAREDVVAVLQELERSREYIRHLEAQNRSFLQERQEMEFALRETERDLGSRVEEVQTLQREVERQREENVSLREMFLSLQQQQQQQQQQQSSPSTQQSRLREHVVLLQREIAQLRSQLKEQSWQRDFQRHQSPQSSRRDSWSLPLQQQQDGSAEKKQAESSDSVRSRRSTAGQPTSPSSSSSIVYRQREERARVLEIKLRDLLPPH